MNPKRREFIAKAADLINQAKGILEECRDDEQEYYDNMPENLQNGDKGNTAQEGIGVLEEAIDALENIDLSEFEG